MPKGPQRPMIEALLCPYCEKMISWQLFSLHTGEHKKRRDKKKAWAR